MDVINPLSSPVIWNQTPNTGEITIFFKMINDASHFSIDNLPMLPVPKIIRVICLTCDKFGKQSLEKWKTAMITEVDVMIPLKQGNMQILFSRGLRRHTHLVTVKIWITLI